MSDSTPLLAGLDLGTTTIKALVCRPDGPVLASAAVATPTLYPRPGWAEHHPEALWQAAAAALGQALAQVAEPHRVVAVAVASVGETTVALDGAGRPVGEAIAWFDGRARPQIDELFDRLGPDRLFAVTGLPRMPIWGLAKLRWLQEHRPESTGRMAHWLNLADYIAYRLCGEMVMDHSLASRTLGLDLARRTWARELIADMGIDPAVLPPLAPSGVAIGQVTRAAEAATGLATSVRVVTGGHDHICGAMALGANRPGILLDSMGSAEAALVALDRPVQDPEFGRRGFSQGVHVAGNYYALGGIYVSGVAVDWLRNRILDGIPYDRLIRDAGGVEAGSRGVTFLPRLRLANPGLTEEYPRGAFIGLTDTVDRSVLSRAVLEGLCFEYRYSLERLLELAGFPDVEQVLVTGGSTRNPLWLEIKAAVLGRPLHVVQEEECTALGAALLAGIGAGIYRDAAEAAGRISIPADVIEPDPALRSRYQDIFHSVYLPLSDALVPVHAALQRLA